MKNLFNLEPFCADYGMRLVTIDERDAKLEERENIINKALGILVENGLYAMSVFLLSCNKEKYGKHVLKTLLAMCTDSSLPAPLLAKANLNDAEAQLKAVRSITISLDKLILARKMMDQALTFGRYHCKALKKAE